MAAGLRLKLQHLFPLVAIIRAGCGGGTTSSAPPATTSSPTTSEPSPTPSPCPTCSPSGTALEISADNLLYDKECLAVPAGKPFTVTFDNMEVDVSHNVEILDHPGGSSLFTGKIISGPKTITYKLKAFQAGAYYFRCTVHPLRMNGALLVSG